MLGPVSAVLGRLAVGRARKQWPFDGGGGGASHHTLRATDTVAAPTGGSTDAAAMLRDLLWDSRAGRAFDVTCRATDEGSPADAAVAFPSPKPVGHAASDTVHLDWHAARDGRPGDLRPGAPAMLVLDILQGNNLVANFVARSFARHGVHGFVMHMPFTGPRRAPGEAYDWNWFLPSLRQAIADARRARDVIAALPRVDAARVGVQGTSLGGFVATVAAAIDDAFAPAVIALAGGDVYRILSEGRADAARVRGRLRGVGFTDRKLKDELWRSEPLRVAHRLNRRKTGLLTARHDQVVPPRFSKQLADTVCLARPHHRTFAGCHYTCLVSAPWILGAMLQATASPN
jgi:hypothetical protein